MKKYKVLHTINSLSLSDGGPSRTVVNLCDSIAEHDDIKISLLTQKLNNTSLVKSQNKKVNRINCKTNSNLAFKLGLPINNYLKKYKKIIQPSIIHDHGLWQPSNYWASYFAKKHNLPIIIQPRGMLEQWALNHKLIKKNIAMSLYQKSNLLNANLIAATSYQEYESIRKIGLKNPVAVIPNGIKMPDSNDLNLKNKRKDASKQALFLSRLHSKKGIANLIHAWKKVMPDNWTLNIVGPDENNHLQEIKRLALKLGIKNYIKFHGELYGTKKQQAYLKSDLFILPTFSENFGVVVAEALSYGLPVITTKGAPWQDLEKFNCGWWIDIGIEPLSKALNEATSIDDKTRKMMGKNGRDYVCRYDWRSIGQDMKSVYDFILGRIDKPDNIYEN